MNENIQRALSSEQLCKGIREAFSQNGWKLFEINCDNFDEIIQHRGRNGDRFTLSCLPGLLEFALLKVDSNKIQRIRSLIGMLNVDFFEENPGDWIELKQSNMQMFELLGKSERLAIVAWLEFIHPLVQENEFDKNEVESALRFWRKLL